MLKSIPNLELGLITNEFHEVWWFTICRKTCQDNARNMPKVQKEHSKTNTRQAPNGTRPIYLANKGLVRWRKKSKTFSKWHQTLQDPSRGWKKTTHQSWAHLGQVRVRPHHFWGPLGPSLAGCLIPPLQRQFRRVGPGSTYLDVGLKVSLHIPRNHSFLSTYKRRPPPPHSTTPQGRRAYLTWARATPLQGLRP